MPTSPSVPVPPSLREIKNPRIRNLLRGAISSPDEDIAKRTMESLRKECTLSDAVVVFRFLVENPLARHVPKALAFPTSPGDVYRLPLYQGSRLEIELIEQALRIGREVDKIADAIRLIGQLDQAILARDFDGIDQLFDEYRQRFGVSLLVANKAISLRHSELPIGMRRAAFGDVTEPFSTPIRQVLTVAFEDSVDDDRDYMRTRRAFLEFVVKDQVDLADAVILADMLSPLGAYRFDAAMRVQAYGRWSVVDTVSYLFRLRQQLALEGREVDVELIDAAIPPPVKEAWVSSFKEVDPAALQALLGMPDQFFDRLLFAHLPAWSEYPNLYEYRLRIERAVGERLDGRFPVKRGEASIIAAPREHVNDLLSNGASTVQTGMIDPRTSGGFHRTIALIASLEAGGLAGVDGESLRRLLDQTIDVSALLSRPELAAFLPRRPSDRLYEFFRAALFNELDDSKVSNHAVRRALQDVVHNQFEGNIVALLKHIDTNNDHVARHLYHLCTEAFLTELYDLFQESDDVTEAQASILEWRAANQGDEDAALRAKSHRLNLRLRKVRGAIEETRIYVDPLRFLDWVHETKTTELRTLSPFAFEILASPDRSLSLTDAVRVTVEPRLRLLKLLDDCYHEFCTNKIYGVTSFIGRRIRHGALHGHLVLEFAPKVQGVIQDLRHYAPKFSAFLSDWIARFDTAVLQLANEQIHVKSKDRPKGLINATLDETDKAPAAERMLKEVALSMLDGSPLTHSTAVIGEYCWLVFEVDLKRARAAVEELRREFAIHSDDHCCGEVELDRTISDRIRILNSELQHRFDIVASWLTRPSSISPSASIALLFQVVFNEIQGRYPDFRPKLETQVEQDVNLIGHRFGYFYDALYILVDNAAKHGDRSGRLVFNVEMIDDDRFTDLKVTVTSDLPKKNREKAVANIEDAMNAEIGDAMMDIGQSGIRKLRGLVESLDELVAFRRDYDEATVTFTLDMRLPRN